MTMTMSLFLLSKIVTQIVSGPISKLLEAEVQDRALRQRLAAELEAKLLEHLGRETALQQGVVLAEVQSENWLARSWRPLMMLALLGVVLFVGLGLPLLDALFGRAVTFQPRWHLLPPEFWSFLSIGVGGYVGGRSLEKAATGVAAELVRKRR
jgi:Holin of 3TMs, for gene-transfer release